MKVVIEKPFVDREDEKKAYQPKQVVEFEDKRAEALIERGLVSLYEEPAKGPKK